MLQTKRTQPINFFYRPSAGPKRAGRSMAGGGRPPPPWLGLGGGGGGGSPTLIRSLTPKAARWGVTRDSQMDVEGGTRPSHPSFSVGGSGDPKKTHPPNVCPHQKKGGQRHVRHTDGPLAEVGWGQNVGGGGDNS